MKSAPANFFERLSTKATRKVGSTGGFIIAMLVVVVWMISGPFFHFSNTWQLVINTGTTIITFLMVFLIQRGQNKDALAMQIKLNELIASSHNASNRLIDIEDLTEEELVTLEKHFAELVKRSRESGDMQRSHSIEEAAGRHEEKSRARQEGRNSKTGE